MSALPSLRERHPDLLIDVDTGANRISRLEDGIDAAIAVAESVDDKYYSRIIERGRIVAIGSPRLMGGDRPICKVDDLARAHILLHREMLQAFEKWRDSLGMHHLEPAGASYYDSGQLILDAAAQGLGIAFMLESHLAGAHRAGLKQFFGHSAISPYAYWFVCSPAALARRPVKIFHDWLFEHFSNEEGVPEAKAA
jgi:LysR family glycine cleavage system transcriptional activator